MEDMEGMAANTNKEPRRGNGARKSETETGRERHAAVPVVPGVYRIPLGPVNAYLIDDTDSTDGVGLTLIDTGIPGSVDKILSAVRELDREPSDVRNILVTHVHADHTGSLAALKRATGARVYMHAADAELLRKGIAGRPVSPAPGLFNHLLYAVIFGRRSGQPTVEPAEVEHLVADGDRLDLAGSTQGFQGMGGTGITHTIQAIHIPGHCAGQLAFLWPRHGGVMFVADAASNMFGLGYAPIYEDLAEGRRSLRKLSEFKYEVACFGHGNPIVREAARRFADKWCGRSGQGGSGKTGKGDER